MQLAKIQYACFLCFVLICITTKSLLAQNEKVDYFPSMAGNKYKYSGYFEHAPEFPFVDETTIRYFSCCNNQPSLNFSRFGTLIIEEDAFYYPNECKKERIAFYKYPLSKIGDTITYPVQMKKNSNEYRGWSVRKAGTVKVPAGTFYNCVVVRETVKTVAFDLSLTTQQTKVSYFAPGIGLIKTLEITGTDLFGNKYIVELLSYDLADNHIVISHILKHNNEKKILSKLPKDKWFSVCSDGAPVSFFEITADNVPASIFLPSLLDNLSLRVSGNNQEFGKITLLSRRRDKIEFQYTHPLNIHNDKSLFAVIELELFLSNSPCTVLKKIPIEVYNPPILFVHGLWGNVNSFREMFNRFEQLPGYDFSNLLRVNYEDTNANMFADNSDVIPRNIDVMIKRLAKSKIACGKANIVAHSMGGILTRLYVQGNAYRNDVYKIITINTPHAGSQLADYILDERTNGFRKTAFCDFFSCDQGAIQDLAVSSAQIRSMNNRNNINPKMLFKTIVGEIEPSRNMLRAIGLTADEYINLFNGERNDMIVARSSQLGGISMLESFALFAQQHQGAQDNANIISHVIDAMQKPYQEPYFSKVSPVDALVYNGPREENNEPPFILPEISLLSNLQDEVEFGSETLFDWECPSNTIESMLVIGNDLFNDDNAYIFNGTTGKIKKFLTPDRLGKLSVAIMCSDKNNQMSAKFYRKYIFINTKEKPLEIEHDRGTAVLVEVGQKYVTNFIGTFKNFIVAVGAGKGVKYFSKRNLVEYVGEGKIIGLKEGIDTIWIEFNGVVSKPVEVTVLPRTITTSVKNVKSTQNLQEVILYPNPVENQLNLSINPNHSEKMVIDLYDALGKKHLSSSLIGTSQANSIFSIDLSPLPRGFYFVYCYQSDFVSVHKIYKN
jgi:pimeloyl-ACP methyl ester carboxylesterase